jgi:hypothetical protein
MGQIFYFIESVAVGLYVFIGLAFVWSIRNFLRARRELRESQFRLEREQAQQRGGKAMTVIFLSINILVAIWGTANMAAPTWRDGLPPTRNPNRTPIYQTNVPGQGDPFELTPNSQVGDDGIPITAPPPSTPKGTILPRGPREGCIRDTAWIDFPDNGQVVFDVVTVQGTANIQDFAFYRFEIRPSSSTGGMFSVIEGDNTQPVENGPLGQLIPYNYLPGDYRYRLVVFDSASNLRASCEISIVISDPIPTQTPIGGPE